jgi:hypothetical protein
MKQPQTISPARETSLSGDSVSDAHVVARGVLKPSHMKIEITDAGRSQSGIDEKLDCTVRATAIAFGVPYLEAHAKLSAAGRKRKRKFSFRADSIENLGFELRPDLSCMTVEKAVSQIPSGRFVLRISGHVFAVVDGTIYDNKPVKPKARVKMAYEVSAREVK